ncbi:DUF3971 domain-containing protein [Planctomycetota bacterium]
MSRMHAKKDTSPSRSVRLLKMLSLSAAVILLLAIFYSLLTHNLPRKVILEISRLTNTSIEMARLHANLRGHVAIENLVIRPFGATLTSQPLLRAGEVQIQFSLGSLIRLQPKIETVNVQNFMFNALYDPNSGQWNTSHLKRPAGGKGSIQIPQIHLHNGTLRYGRVEQDQVNTVAVLPLEATLSLSDPNVQGYDFAVKTGAIYRGIGQSTLQGHWRPGALTLAGGLSSQDTPALERVWSAPIIAGELTYDPQGNYAMHLRVRELSSVRYTESQIPPLGKATSPRSSTLLAGMQRFFGRYEPTGTAHLTLDANGKFSTIAKSRFSGTVECQDVSVRDQKFPYALNHLEGLVHFSENGLKATGLRGRHGPSEIQLDFHNRRAKDHWQYEVQASSERILLDDDLYRALGAKQQGFWQQFNPTGAARVDYRAWRDSLTHRSRRLRLRLLGTEASYQGFPYPLKNLTGEIQLDPNGMTFTHVAASEETYRIVVNGTIGLSADAPPQPNLRIEAINLPFDKTLGQSLSVSQRDLYEQLQLRGCTDATIHVTPDPHPKRMATFRASVGAEHTTFHIPGIDTILTDATFQIAIEPSSLDIQRITGIHGHSPVQIDGRVWLPNPQAPPAYDVQIRSEAYQVQDVIAVLPSGPAGHLGKLRATGTFKLHGTIQQSDGLLTPQYAFTAKCLGLTANPSPFPYPLKDITGTIVADNNQVALHNVVAIPDVNTTSAESSLGLSGTLVLREGRCVESNLSLSGTDLPISHPFVQALPHPLCDSVARMAPSGRCFIAPSTVTVRQQDDQTDVSVQAQTRVTYGKMTLAESRVNFGAVLNAQCTYRLGKGFLTGQLDMEADHIEITDRTATNVKAHLVYDPASRTWRSSRVLGEFYDGQLVGDITIHWPQAATPVLHAYLSVTDANLFQILQDSSQRKEPTEYSHGSLTGHVSLGIQSADETSPVGRFTLDIRDIEIGRRAPLSHVLEVLHLTDPTDFSFDHLRVDAFILGDQILFDQFDLSGRSLALCGSGKLDLGTNNIQLDLITRGRRKATTNPSVLQALSEGLGGAVVRLEITGPPATPHVTTHALPVIKDSLRILGAPQ